MKILELILRIVIATCDELNQEGNHKTARGFAIFAQRLDFEINKAKRADRQAEKDERKLYNEVMGDGQW